MKILNGKIIDQEIFFHCIATIYLQHCVKKQIILFCSEAWNCFSFQNHWHLHQPNKRKYWMTASIKSNVYIVPRNPCDFHRLWYFTGTTGSGGGGVVVMVYFTPNESRLVQIKSMNVFAIWCLYVRSFYMCVYGSPFRSVISFASWAAQFAKMWSEVQWQGNTEIKEIKLHWKMNVEYVKKKAQTNTIYEPELAMNAKELKRNQTKRKV